MANAEVGGTTVRKGELLSIGFPLARSVLQILLSEQLMPLRNAIVGKHRPLSVIRKNRSVMLFGSLVIAQALGFETGSVLGPHEGEVHR